MMVTVRHVTSGAGRTKFPANLFLLNRVYMFNTGNSMHIDEYGQLLQQIRQKIYHLEQVHMSVLTC
jgi:hypothetical protein